MDLLLNINTIGLILQNNEFISKNIFMFIKIFFYLCIFIFVLLDKRLKKSEVNLIIFSIFILFISKRMYLTTFLLIIIAINRRYYKRYYLINFISLLLLLTLVTGFSRIGVIDNNILKYKIYGYEGIQIRQSLGFGNPNTSGIIFWLIRCSFYYLNYYKIKFHHFIILGILVFILYLQTYSRTSFLIFCFEVMLFYIMKYKYKILKKIIIVIPLIHVLGTFLLSIFFYDTKLNDLLSGRLSYSHIFLKNVNLQNFFFGNKENFYLALDNAWIALLQNYGMLVLLSMLILMILGIKNMLKFESKIESKKIIFLFLICLCYSTSEAVLFSPYYSFIIMILIKYNFLRGEKNVKSRNIKKSTISNAR